VVVKTRILRADKKGRVSVRIVCPKPAGLCDGRLGIGVGRTTLGNTSFVLSGGRTGTVRIKVKSKALKRAIKAKKATVIVLSRDNAGTAAITTRVLKFRK
jgi:hypothetical protein